MKALRLVLITSVCLLMAYVASAQVKIGDDELELGQDHWLEIKRLDTLLIVTDQLQLGRTNDPHTSNPHNPSVDAIMLKLYGYGLGKFVPTGAAPYIQDTLMLGGITSNVFAGITNDGQLLEVPLKMVLDIQGSTVADLSFFNGLDTFGTVDLTPMLEANTFYLADGTLDEDRTVDGGGQTLTFNNLDSVEIDAGFITIDGDQVAIQQDGQDIIQINAVEQVKFRSSTRDSIFFMDTTGILSASYYGDITNADPSFSTIVGVLPDGTLVDVDVNDILGAQEDSTIYTHNGSLSEDRTLLGANLDLTFSGLNVFQVTGDSVDVDATTVDLDGTNYSADYTNITSTATATNASSGADVTVTATGGSTTVGASTDVVVNAATGTVDINTPDVILSDTLNMEIYGSDNIKGTFTTILASDASGKIIELTADEILATQTDSVIYRHDGTLTGDRTLTGANLDLTFSGINVFQVTGDSVDVDATTVDLDGTNYSADYTTITSTATATNASSGADVTVTATGGSTTVGASTDVVVNAATGTVDINTPDVILSDTLNMEIYGSDNIKGTFTTILASDAGGKVIEVTADEILGTQTDSVIYRHDGTLTGDRTLTGANLDLTFSGINVFQVTGDSVDVDATTVDLDGTNYSSDYTNITSTATATNASSGADVTVTATGGSTTVGASADVVVNAATGTVDINTPDVILSDTLNMEIYGSDNIKGTFTTILASDAGGKVIEVTADEILGTQTDSVIYRHDGTLTGDRTLTGANLDLTFSGINVFQVTGDSVDVDATTVDLDGTNYSADYTTITSAATATNASSGADVTVTATGGSTTVGASTDVVVNAATGTVDINTPDVILSDTLNMEIYGSDNIKGTFTTILASDAGGKVIEVTADEILGTQTDSVIYRHDGTLTGDRTLTGANLDLTFSGINVFQVTGDSVDVDATTVDLDGTNFSADYTTITSAATATNASSGADVTVTATGGSTTVGASADVVVNAATGTVDINTPDVILSDTLNMESYGSDNIKGTFTTILASDAAGKIIELTADEILATQTDSVIYRHDGTLTGDRTLTGANLDLTFSGINVFQVTGDSVDVDATTVDLDGTNFSADYTTITSAATATNASSGADVTVTATGGSTTVGASADVVVNAATGTVDINTPDVILSDTLNMEIYGSDNIKGTFTTILASDAGGKVIEVTADEILGTQTDSVIYRHDGTLTGDRTLTGANLDLTFSGINVFQVTGDSVDVDATTVDLDGTNFSADYTTITSAATATNASSGAVVTVTATGGNTTVGASADVVVNAATGTVDINTPDVILSDTLNMEIYGSDNIKGTFTTILASDASGKVIEVTADEILGTETDSVIYRHNGTLTSERYMTMAAFDLNFIDGTDTTVITSDGRMAIGRGTVTQGTGTANDIRLDVNGDILAIQVHSSSDARFKKDIVQLDNALDKVQSINGVTYNFRTEEFPNRNFPTTKQLGFIAQDVEKVIPEVVKTDAQGYKSIDYAKLTALLNEAIKEQQLEIDNLSKQLNQANEHNAHLADEIASIKEIIKGISNLAVSDED